MHNSLPDQHTRTLRLFNPFAKSHEKISGPAPRLARVALVLLSLTLVVLGALNFEQRSLYQLPDDGVSWLDSPAGVTAWIVARDGPAHRAGIREGDVLLAIRGRPVRRSADATDAIFHSEVWSLVTYDLVRQAKPLQARVVIAPQTNCLRRYLDLLGLLYLIVGILIFMRRRATPHALHLCAFCLVSFVLYTFSYTGKLDLFDWTIYWLNVFALILQPALFLHFCLRFREERVAPGWGARATLAAYLPGALLLVCHAGVAAKILVLPLPLLTLRWGLDRVEFLYLTVYFLVGAVFLERACRRAEVRLLQQQLKLVTRATFLAVLPFATLYAVPYFLGLAPAPWMTLSAFSLVSLPLALGYVLWRGALAELRPLSKAAAS